MRYLIIILLFCSPILSLQELNIIKKRYKEIILSYNVDRQDKLWKDLIKIEKESPHICDQVIVELIQRYPFNVSIIEQYISKQKQDGSWEDIDYDKKKPGLWEPKLHVVRVLELSKLYYIPSTKYYHKDIILHVIHSALNYWFINKPKSFNWWHNKIFVPKTFGEAFILLENELSSEEKEKAIEILSNSKFERTGQNKVWMAGNILMKGLLENNKILVKKARDVLDSEIVISQKEGIKSDWSYHQHGPQQQFGNYGMAYILGMSFYTKLFKDTSYAFETEKINILKNLVNEGYRWIIWNRYFDISAMDRQLFHNAQILKAYATEFVASDFELKEFSEKNNDTFIGHKHFDDSDYTIHRTKQWISSLKMSSKRVIGTEKVGRDNILGYYLGDGATYYYTNGNEYLNIFPLWDWEKIPGVTAYENNLPFPPKWERNNSYLVGGLTNGNQGMSSMELYRNNLKAYKSWIFTKDFVLCLGTGINSDLQFNVTTSVDQCLRKDKLFILKENNWKHIQRIEEESKETRLFHNQTGYILFGNPSYVAEEVKRTGNWNDFTSYKSKEVEGDVISIYLRHGRHPKNEKYQYIVLPATTLKKVQIFNIEKIKVIRNDSKAQIVWLEDTKDFWMSVYQIDKFVFENCTLIIFESGIYNIKYIKDKCEIVKKNKFQIEI